MSHQPAGQVIVAQIAELTQNGVFETTAPSGSGIGSQVPSSRRSAIDDELQTRNIGPGFPAKAPLTRTPARSPCTAPGHSCVHASPSLDASTVASAPTARNAPPANATASRSADIAAAAASHVTPSAERMIAPMAPTATKTPLPYATPCSESPGSGTADHADTSADTTAVPSPTPTHRPPPYATSRRWFACGDGLTSSHAEHRGCSAAHIQRASRAMVATSNNVLFPRML